MSLLQVQGLGINFGGLIAVNDLTFSVEKGEIYSIIGPNGAGKTTLFNMISGVYRPSIGRVLLNGADVTRMRPDRLAKMGMCRTFQNLQIFFRMSVLENVMVGRHLHEQRSFFPHFLGLPSVGRQNQASADKAMELLKLVRLDKDAETIAGNLSYGALKRLEIARALAAEPAILLLDEPAAGCNSVETAEIEHLIQDIAKTGVTIVLVEHDMKLVMKISDRILVLLYGRKLTEGTPAEVRQNPEVIAAYLGSHGQKEADRA